MVANAVIVFALRIPITEEQITQCIFKCQFHNSSFTIHHSLAMTLSQAQITVDSWIKQYGVRYFNELTNMALLTEEVGELARIMARKYGEQSFKESEKNTDPADEMADILFVLICLANQTGVNLEEAFENNLKKKTSRDSGRHLSNPKL